jgi:hypothetical protein
MTVFTTVTGLAFNAKGRLYVLELSSVQTSDFPEPFTGKMVRVDASGQIEDFVTGLMVPTGCRKSKITGTCWKGLGAGSSRKCTNCFEWIV